MGTESGTNGPKNRDYRILIVDDPDKVGIFVKVGRDLIEKYSRDSLGTLKSEGYAGDRMQFAQDIALAFYARICAEEETPRTVFWPDDDKTEVLKKLKDVVAYQRWGKTLNQLPKIGEAFNALNTGIVKSDSVGYARGMAVKALISATHDRDEKPIVYFDKLRKYPAWAERFIELLDIFDISDEDLESFDPDFSEYITEMLIAAAQVREYRKPDAEPWESASLSDNPLWQKYQDDWDDYQAWLDRRK